MKTLPSIFIILGFIMFTFAHAATPSKGQPQNNPSRLEQQPAATQEKVRLLKAELQLIKSYQDNFLYWSLGVLGTIAVGLIGFGWFANFKRDKSAVRAVSEAEIRKHTEAIPELIEVNTDKNK